MHSRTELYETLVVAESGRAVRTYSRPSQQ